MLVLAALVAIAPSPASAYDGEMLDEITADQGPTHCDTTVGIAFDGTNLLLSCIFTNEIDVINPADGTLVDQFSVVGEDRLGALAFDAHRGKMWACRWDPDSGLFLVDINGASAGATSNPITMTGAGCGDGLAFDATDESIFHSGDQKCEVGHTPITATVASGSTNVCSPPRLGSGANSGIVVGGARLYMADPVGQKIWRVEKDFSSSTLFATINQRPEDMECDNVTFPGKSAIWVVSNLNRVLRAYEIPAGSCNFGGVPPPGGVLRVCKKIAPDSRKTALDAAQSRFYQPPFPLTANGAAFTVAASTCVVVGEFDFGEVVTVKEDPLAGFKLSQIDVVPGDRLVPGSEDHSAGRVKVTMGSGDMTTVTFWNTRVAMGSIRICKDLAAAPSFPLIVNVHYSVPGAPGGAAVQHGKCTDAIPVTADPAVTVTEHAPAGERVVGCSTAPSASLLVSCVGNTATVEVVPGAETVVTFTNGPYFIRSGRWGRRRRSRITTGVVDKVLDARTLHVRTTSRGRPRGIRKLETVRLLGIDAPRFTRLGASEECAGRQAVNAMLRSAFGASAKDTDADALEDDTGAAMGLDVFLQTARPPGRDRSGRLLAYVDDGVSLDDLGERQISAGLARSSATGLPFSRSARYRAAQSRAKRAKRGVWSLCRGDFHRELPPPKPYSFEPGPEEQGR